MQLIPAALVPAVRAAIQGQGGNPDIVNWDGTVNPAGIVSQFFNEVRVSTAITPDLVFPIGAGGAPPDPAMQELMHQLQPAVTLTGPAGTVSITPYGQPLGQRSWLPVGLAVAGVLGFAGWAIFGGKR